MVKTADIFVYNIRPQPMRKLGFGSWRLSCHPPRLIYCEFCGFFEAKPYAGRPASDDIIYAVGGLADLPCRGSMQPPNYVMSILVDKITGLAGLNGILATLYKKEQSPVWAKPSQSPCLKPLRALTSWNTWEGQHLATPTWFMPAPCHRFVSPTKTWQLNQPTALQHRSVVV